MTNPIGKHEKYSWMLLPTLLIILILIIIPVLKIFSIAFMNYSMLNLNDLYFNGFDNFKMVIFNPTISFIQIVLNSLLWVFLSVIFQFSLGFLLALLLKEAFRGRGLYTSLVFYTWALSGFAIGIIWAWLFNGQFGMINDLLLKSGIISKPVNFLSNPHYAMIAVIIANIWYGVPYFSVMLLAALQSVPQELYESAQIDGAGKLGQLLYVTIPYISSTISSTILLRCIWIMNYPDLIFGMTGGGPANSTNILATEMINKIIKEYNFGQGAAIGVIIISILFVFSFFYIKHTLKEELTL